MPVEWYRIPDFDQAARDEFNRRYARARPPWRVQYKRIKLTLAEILLDNDPDGLLTVTEILESSTLARRLLLRSDEFRFQVATARAHKLLGRDPASPARRALDLLEADRTPQFPRHPTVGRIDADEQTIRSLHGLARTHPSRAPLEEEA